MTNWLRTLIALGCLGFNTLLAQGQTYPSKIITIVAPSVPGGITDTLARLLAQHFSAAWGQQVIVLNKPGANHQIGAEFVARSVPDGYTLFLSPEATFVVNPSLFAKLNYDPVKDFVPISGLVSIHHSLIVYPQLPVQNVKELIELAKKKPGELTYGTFGVGSTGHINMEMFQTMAGVKLLPVHYKGATPALMDVIAGHIQMMFLSVGSAMPSQQSGKVRMIAVASKNRIPQLPDIPIVAESGLTDFEAVSWFGLFAPAGTPYEIVVKLNAEVQRILNDPVFRKKVIEPQLFIPMMGSPEEFAAYIRADVQKWSRVLRATNVKIE